MPPTYVGDRLQRLHCLLALTDLVGMDEILFS